MSASEKRKKSRLKIRDKYTQIANLKKLNDRGTTDSRGRKKKLKTGGANIPSEGQRKLVLQAGGQGMGSDYKKSEQQAFKKAKKWQKSDEKKKITNKKKGNNNTGGGSSNKTSGPKTPAGYVRYKGKLLNTRTAKGMHAANRLKAKERAKEMAKKRKENK